MRKIADMDSSSPTPKQYGFVERAFLRHAALMKKTYRDGNSEAIWHYAVAFLSVTFSFFIFIFVALVALVLPGELNLRHMSVEETTAAFALTLAVTAVFMNLRLKDFKNDLRAMAHFSTNADGIKLLCVILLGVASIFGLGLVLWWSSHS
jgi:hypothetical protein